MQNQSPYSVDSRPRPAPRPYQAHRSRREKETALAADYSSSDGEDAGSPPHGEPVYDRRQRNGTAPHLGEYELFRTRRVERFRGWLTGPVCCRLDFRSVFGFGNNDCSREASSRTTLISSAHQQAILLKSPTRSNLSSHSFAQS